VCVCVCVPICVSVSFGARFSTPGAKLSTGACFFDVVFAVCHRDLGVEVGLLRKPFLDDFWRRMAMKSPTTMDTSETTPDSLLWTFFRPSAAPAFTEPPRQQGFQTTRRNARRDAAENTLYYDDRASAAQRYAARSTSPLTLFCETTPHDITQTRSG